MSSRRLIMLGAIIGDIVGSRFEFLEDDNCSKNFALFTSNCRPTDDSFMMENDYINGNSNYLIQNINTRDHIALVKQATYFISGAGNKCLRLLLYFVLLIYNGISFIYHR